MPRKEHSVKQHLPWGGTRLALGLLLAGLLAGCSAAAVDSPPVIETPAASSMPGDPEAGRQVWDRNGCGTCHTLAAAQADGTVGPSLDEVSLTSGQIVERVKAGKDSMPAYAALLAAQEIADVSQFVLLSASGEAAPAQPVATPSEVGGQREEESTVSTIDLTAFVEAWSSGDLAAIRSQYTEDAVYLSAEEVVALQHQRPVSAPVQDETFADEVHGFDGMTLRILGDPQQVTDKQAMFFFRWEGEAQGKNGVALLRYEGDKVWMHVFALSEVLTPNPAPGSEALEAYDVEPLMQAWRSAEFGAVSGFYTDDLAIFNDEDILRALNGDYHSQAELDGGYLQSELREQGSWGMSASAPAVRLGDLVLLPWHWASLDYPVGYGVRMLRLDGDRVSQDFRFALRPWEVSGGTSASGY